MTGDETIYILANGDMQQAEFIKGQPAELVYRWAQTRVRNFQRNQPDKDIYDG
jgi:hypothetical protein